MVKRIWFKCKGEGANSNVWKYDNSNVINNLTQSGYGDANIDSDIIEEIIIENIGIIKIRTYIYYGYYALYKQENYTNVTFEVTVSNINTNNGYGTIGIIARYREQERYITSEGVEVFGTCAYKMVISNKSIHMNSKYLLNRNLSQ